MATIYSSRHSKPLGAGRHGFGGAALNLPVDHLSGEADLTGTFDDFQQVIDATDLLTATVNANSIRGYSWTITQTAGAAPVGSSVFVNDPAAAGHWEDTLTIDCGTAADTGGNLQFLADGLNVVSNHFNGIWLPDSGVATALDNTVVTFAARVGFTVAAGSVFDGKLFIGFATAGDLDIMVEATGAIDVAAGAGADGGVVGIHFNADPAVTPNISLVSQRTFGTAMAEGTNFTPMVNGGAAVAGAWDQGLTATVPRFFDVAFRMHVTNWSDNAANGATRGYWRRVPSTGGSFEGLNQEAPGLRETQASDSGAVRSEEWSTHDTVLQNQVPAALATRYVPTIEAINGPAQDADFFVDWWSMGVSRFSRRGA